MSEITTGIRRVYLPYPWRLLLYPLPGSSLATQCRLGSVVVPGTGHGSVEAPVHGTGLGGQADEETRGWRWYGGTVGLRRVAEFLHLGS